MKNLVLQARFYNLAFPFQATYAPSSYLFTTFPLLEDLIFLQLRDGLPQFCATQKPQECSHITLAYTHCFRVGGGEPAIYRQAEEDMEWRE